MNLRVFLALWFSCFSCVCVAQDFYTVEELKALVQKRIEHHYRAQFSNKDLQNNMSINVSNLDARLRLKRCEQDLEASINQTNSYANNLSVKVSCRGSQPWSIYVPASVERFEQVAVASKSLARGHIVTQEDISFVRMAIGQAGAGYVVDAERLIGLQLKRSVQSGHPIRLSHTGQPKVVKKGDKVLLEASNQLVSVMVNGFALASGELGEQIRVQNASSKRIVDATVIAPGRVQVNF